MTAKGLLLFVALVAGCAKQRLFYCQENQERDGTRMCIPQPCSKSHPCIGQERAACGEYTGGVRDLYCYATMHDCQYFEPAAVHDCRWKTVDEFSDYFVVR